jgi:hypothetical protein
MREPAPFPEERLSLYHLLSVRKPRQRRLITEIMNSTWHMHTTTGAIRKVFYSERQTAYNRLIVDSSCAEELYSVIQHTVPEDLWDVLDAPITENEIRLPIEQAPHNKSPGIDGLSAEFYFWSWEVVKEDLTIMYNTCQTGRMTSAQKQGITVCIPKKDAPTQVKNYRPLTLLNAEYKIYARVLANRMEFTLHTVLHPNQYSCAQGRTILDATAGLRGIIACGTLSPRGLCLLALDFAQAFDKLSHEYLFGLWNATVTVRRSEVLFPYYTLRHGRACVLTDICLTVSQ